MKIANNYINEAILKDLTTRYQKITLTKKELAKEEDKKGKKAKKNESK